MLRISNKSKVNFIKFTLVLIVTFAFLASFFSLPKTTKANPGQYSRPNSDISTGNWIESGGNNVFYDELNETVANGDISYVQTIVNPEYDYIEIGLNSLDDPVSSTGHIVKYQYRNAGNAGGGGKLNLSVSLKQGGTTIASWEHLNIKDNSYVTEEQTLSAEQADSITDYSNLSLKFEVDYIIGTGDRQLRLTWAEFEIPDVPPIVTVGTTGSQTANMGIPSTNQYLGGAFTFIRNSGSADATQIILNETGSINANSYLKNVELYYETAGSCSYNGDETLFGPAVSFSGNIAVINGTMPVGASQVCLYVVLDVELGAAGGQTIEIEISNPSTDVTIVDSNVMPASTVAIAGTTTLVEEALTATAEVDTNWVKGGASNQNFIFTINNNADSSAAVQWVKITRPNSNYTLTAGIASGWSANVTASDITFTGGNIAAGNSGTFTVTLNVASADQDQASWMVRIDDDAGGASPISASASSAGALNTGIDSTAPTGVSIDSVTVNSNTKLTANAATAADSASGLNAEPYWFDETSGNPGGSDSVAWQTSAAFEDIGLSASTTYCYRVKARDAVGNESAYSDTACETTSSEADTIPPSAVLDLTVGTITDNSVNLSWTSPGDDGSSGTADTYDIRYSTTEINEGNWASASQAIGEPSPSIADSPESFTVTGLNNNTLYYFAIKTLDEAPNASPISNVVSATTKSDSTAPTISSVSVADITQDSVIILWTTNETSDSEVEYGDSFSYGETATDASLVTLHSVLLTGLDPDTVYQYRVKSTDTSENTAISINYDFTTLPFGISGIDRTPPIISQISTSTTQTTATITWKTDDVSTGEIEYGKTSEYGLSTGIDNTYLQDHEIVIENLDPEIEYNFRIISRNRWDRTSVSENLTFTTGRELTAAELEAAAQALPTEGMPPPIISNVSVVGVQPTSVKIAWQTDIPATTQIIFGTSPGELTQVTIEFVTLVVQHSITVSDLNPETTYYFAAVSRNATGNRKQSEEKTFQTESIEIQTIVDIPKPTALPPGSPGTQIPRTAAGETVTLVPIRATSGDNQSPSVTLFQFTENPTENTSPVIRGRATDQRGVIAGISYSTDNGISWHPITDVTGIGSSVATFSAKIPYLRDGNYPILFRVRDNSGNYGRSEAETLIIDIQPPATGANIMLLGTQSIVPSTFGTLSTLTGITQRMAISSIGGAVSVEILAVNEETKEETSFPLIYSKSADLWFGDISFKDSGKYQLWAEAIDGAERVSVRPINPIVVSAAGKVTDAKTEKPVNNAKVSVYQYSPEQGDFVLWPGEVFNQANPQFTDTNGNYRFIIPPGKYFLKVESDDYRTFYTNITESAGHETFNFNISVSPRPQIKLPFSIFGVKKITLPTLPDFWGMRRTAKLAPESITPPDQIGAMLNKPAPVFALPDPSGEPLDIRYLRGKKTILSTWSTWSPLAQIQIPILDQLQQEEQEDVRVLLMSIHESQGIVKTYLERGGYQIPSIIDKKGDLTDLYPIFTLPQHFFLDRKGVIKDVYVGFLSDRALREKLNNFQ